MTPHLVHTLTELEQLDQDTMLTLRPPHPPRTTSSLAKTLSIAPDLHWRFPVAVIATGGHVRAVLQALEET